MGKQYNKVEKRSRRKNYLKRKREKLLSAKKLSKSTNDTKTPKPHTGKNIYQKHEAQIIKRQKTRAQKNCD